MLWDFYFFISLVLNYIYLMFSDAEHPSIYSLVICISSLKKHLFKSLVHF